MAANRVLPPEEDKKRMKVDHASIYRDPYSYCSHPSIRRLADGEWVIAFMESVRRSVVLHSPSDPRFYNVLTRSIDRGLTGRRRG